MGLLDDWLGWRQGNRQGLLDATQAGADATLKALRGGLLSDAEREALVNTPAAWLGTDPMARAGKASAATLKELRAVLGKQSSLLKESPPVSEDAAAKALADIRGGVSPYYALTEASGFSMEPAAVAQRAQSAGFSQEPLYHGSSSTEITAFNPKKVGSFTGAADADTGFFSTPNPRYAHNYMGKVMEQTLDPRLYDQMELEIEPLWNQWLKSRHTDPALHEQLGRQIEDIRRGYDGRAFNPEYSPGAIYPLRIAPGNVKEIDWRGSNMPMAYRGNRVRDAAASGYDSARYVNTPGGALEDEIIAFKPQQLRSPFAAYNPNWVHRPDLLAAHTPAPLGGLLTPDDERRKR